MLGKALVAKYSIATSQLSIHDKLLNTDEVPRMVSRMTGCICRFYLAVEGLSLMLPEEATQGRGENEELTLHSSDFRRYR